MTRTITFTNYYSSLSICCSGVVQKNNGKHDILTEKYNLFSKKKNLLMSNSSPLVNLRQLGHWYFRHSFTYMIVIQHTRKSHIYLHSAFNTCAMVAERTAEDSVKLVHSLLRWWLCFCFPLPHSSNPSFNTKPFHLKQRQFIINTQQPKQQIKPQSK